MFLDIINLLGEAVANTVSDSNRVYRIQIQNSSLFQIGQCLAIFCAMFSLKAQTVSICLIDSQTSL